MSAFKRLQSALQNKGYSEESAGAIAASAGRRKYGAKIMRVAAKKHMSAQSVKNHEKK